MGIRCIRCAEVNNTQLIRTLPGNLVPGISMTEDVQHRDVQITTHRASEIAGFRGARQPGAPVR